MAVKSETTRSRIERIKSDLQTISTCTAATLVELHSLLGESTNQVVQKENVRAKSTKALVPPTARRKGAATCPARAVPPIKQVATILEAREKYILATEVANTTLKLLADALKTQPNSQPPTSDTNKICAEENTKEPRTNGASQLDSTSVSARPLQERSVSQVTNSPNKPSSVRRALSSSPSRTDAIDVGLTAIAECARAAFASLRKPEVSKMAGKETPQLQLENGMLALIGKLVAHNLNDPAAKELRILKKRLDRFLGPKTEERTISTTARKETSMAGMSGEDGTLASLLDFGDVERDSPALPIIASHQLYTLRIIASTKQPRTIEAAWKYLKLSNPSSPANTLWCFASLAGNQAKGARQLESLAQIILSLCPGISSADDATSANDRLYPAPEIALSLQHLAFKTRQRWWTLAKHQGIVERDLHDPFSKCIAAFARRSGLAPIEKYKTAESLYKDLVGASADTKLSQQANIITLTRAAKHMSSLAQAAGLYKEALCWLGPASSPNLSSKSAVESPASLVRKGVVCLEASLKTSIDPGLEDTIAEALTSLSGKIGGSSSQLEELLSEANNFRRAATRALLTAITTSKTSSIPKTLCFHALRIVAATVHLCTRLLGTKSSSGSDDKAHKRPNELATKLSKHVKSILDSVLVCSKYPLSTEWRWYDLDNLIQDCRSILKHFGQDDANDKSIRGSLSEDQKTPLVRLSHSCWTVHLQTQTSSGICEESIEAMQRSIDMLRDCSQIERHAGLLTMKLEKLAEALDAIGQAEKSRTAYFDCIQHLIADGALHVAMEHGARIALLSVWESTEAAGLLGRAIKSFQRSFINQAIRLPETYAFYDDSSLPKAGRGLILEWQLVLFLKALSKNRSWNATLNGSILAIVDRLSELYKPVQFPVRRLRFTLVALRLSLQHPEILPPFPGDVNTANICEGIQENSQDAGLSQYSDHLSAILRLKMELGKDSPCLDVLKDCVATWQTLLDSVPSWRDLMNRVDDPDYWLHELQALADLLSAKGEDYACISVLHLITRIFELKQDVDLSALVTSLCSLGRQYARLGYSGKAGLMFARAESFLSRDCITTEAKLLWHLGYAEYLLSIGNVSKCETTLTVAEVIAREDTDFMDLVKPSTTLSGRVTFNTILADTYYVYSLLALHSGFQKDALKYAKQCVSINRRTWAALENRNASKRAQHHDSNNGTGKDDSDGTFDPLSSLRNDKGAPMVTSMTHESLNGPDFWPLVPSLYRGMMQHALIFKHQGLFQEAMFVLEQAGKIVSATGSRMLLLDNIGQRAACWAECCRSDKASQLIANIDQLDISPHLAIASYYANTARIHHANAKYGEELSSYNTAKRLLEDLASLRFLQRLDMTVSSVDILAQQMSTVTLNEKPPKISKPLKTSAARKVPTKAASKASRKPVKTRASPTSSVADECLPLNVMKAGYECHAALASLQVEDDVQRAMTSLEGIQALNKGCERSILHLWAESQVIVAHAMKELAHDFTLNTLPESTIALPALVSEDQKSSGDPPTHGTLAVVPVAKTRGKKMAVNAIVDSLRGARNQLVEAQALCSQAGTSHDFSRTSYSLARLTVLLSVLSNGEVQGSLHPLFAAYMSETPRNLSLKLTQAFVETEQESVPRDELFKWPDLTGRARCELPSTASFQEDYIDIIPMPWAVIALALSEARDELYITRYETGHSPFILRIPLSRHTSRDMDEQEFSFDDGRRDFDEIIELSDFSTRSAKDMTSKEARTQWWAERDALDERLHGLLINIENIWLGGFKGIFSQHPRQSALLSRFRKSFDNILNRHLPSRQGKSKQRKAVFDSRVLDLFIGLGDTMDEENDLDEPLADLVYFIVDILHFKGEHNPYDEIDFDAIVIETMDALRAYHSATQKASDSISHTILILDKNLHAFPWESLPCLQSQSISRLPSLAALRERLLAAKPSACGPDAQPGHYIGAEAGGTSILNPSGDLGHTLKTLKPRLDEMQGPWTHIANRAPSEKEFEASLKETELVLYFGHGSGAQFVRSKSVRRLYPGSAQKEERGCATTFLFGCSSVHLTENGIYEPSGMLASYLVAGAPAVVGMLWDVTDKDCDRFAVRAGELWGLWPETKSEEEAVMASKKSKGKGRVAQLVAEVESARGAGTGKKSKKGRDQPGDGLQDANATRERRRGVGLDEAVREARDACVLRYLNGAAAVVYGIPVYLE